jgi:hypothetical protein
MLRLRFFLAALAATSLFACSSARIVRETQTGGTVALRGSRDGAREKAEALMQAKCPRGYTILEQGEVAYGQQATTTQWNRNTATTQVEDKHEWQIVFQCAGSAAGAAPFVVRF